MKTWHKVVIGFALAVLIVVGLGVGALFKLQKTLYPDAPPMPAVVSETMPEILARLEAVLKTNAPQVVAELQPGLSADQISKLEAQYHFQLPDDLKAIYQWHNGSVRVTDTNRLADFIPLYRFLPLEEALSERAMMAPDKAPLIQRVVFGLFAGHRESWFCLFDDGARNGYWFDPKRKPTEGAVFYNFTEDADYVFFPSFKNLMAGIAECYQQGAFHLKKDSKLPGLDEDFDKAHKIWTEFGARNSRP